MCALPGRDTAAEKIFPASSDVHVSRDELCSCEDTSCVQEFIGATATRAVKAAKNRPKLCVPIVITCPAGSCDPITTRNQFERFCVPESMAQRSMLPGHHPERNPPETSYRMHYPVRSVKDLERNQSAVARQAEDAALRKVVFAHYWALEHLEFSGCVQENSS